MQQGVEPEARNEEEALVERWQKRQEQLSDLLTRCGATDSERRIDWIEGHIEWVDGTGTSVVVGEMRALCSFSRPDGSLMMAWANPESNEGAVIDPQPDVPDLIEDCTEADAWLWAMSLAETVEAQYLYRFAGSQFLVFLGLWNVRDPLDRKSVQPGSASAFVVDLVQELEKALQEEEHTSASLRRRFINQGESLLQNSVYLEGQGADSSLLQRTAEELIGMGESFGQRRFGVLPPAPLSPEESEQLKRRLFRLRRDWLRAGVKRWR